MVGSRGPQLAPALPSSPHSSKLLSQCHSSTHSDKLGRLLRTLHGQIDGKMGRVYNVGGGGGTRLPPYVMVRTDLPDGHTFLFVLLSIGRARKITDGGHTWNDDLLEKKFFATSDLCIV